jgi:hypothetical protein
MHKKLCSTAAKREALATRIKNVAALHGATVEDETFPDRLRVLNVSVGPFRCMIDLDGSTNVEGFFGHWHIAWNEEGADDAKYSYAFAGAIRGSVNNYTWRKATAYEDTFEGLLRSLEHGLGCLNEMRGTVAA